MSLLQVLGLPPVHARRGARPPSSAPGSVQAGGNTSEPGDAGELRLVSLAITPADAQIRAGEALKLTATGTSSNGDADDWTTAVDWEPSQRGLVKIDGNGVARAAAGAAGQTLTITATDPETGISATTTLMLVPAEKLGPTAPPQIQSVEIEPPEASLNPPFGSVRFTAIGIYANGLPQDIDDEVDWKSSNPKAVEIDKKGTATAVGDGTASIVARHKPSGITSPPSKVVSAWYKPPPVPLRSIEVTPRAPFEALLGTTIRFRAMARYEKGADQDLTSAITWSSSAPKVMSIDANGNARPIIPGRKAVITGRLTKPIAGYNGPAEVVSVTATVVKKLSPPPLPIIYRELPMPYGKVICYYDQEAEVVRIVTPINASFAGAGKASATMKTELAARDAKLKPMLPFLAKPDLVVKAVKEKASDDAVTKENIALAHAESLELWKFQLESIERELTNARQALHTAEQEIDVKSKAIEAVRLREEAEKSISFLDNVLKTIGRGLEFAVHYAELGPLAAIKPGWDAIEDAISSFASEHFLEKAKAMEEEARTLGLKIAQDSFQNAAKDIDAVIALREKARVTKDKVEESVEFNLQRAEDAFDTKAPDSPFQFKQMRAAVASIRKASEAVTQASQYWLGLDVLHGMLIDALASFSTFTQQDRQVQVVGNRAVLDKMKADVAAHLKPIHQAGLDDKKLLDKFGEMRDKANATLSRAKAHR